MIGKTATLAAFLAALCLFGSANARPGPGGQCTADGMCVAKIKRVNVNRGNVSFTLKLPASELDKLPCAAGASVVNFFLPPTDEGNQRYRQMFKMVTLGATRQIPVEVGVTGDAFDCQTSAIALTFGHGHRR